MNDGELKQLFKRVIEPLTDKDRVSDYDVYFTDPKIDNYRRLRYNAAASVSFAEKNIVFYKNYFQKHPEELEGAMRHEIAHIVAYFRIGYHRHNNPVFKDALKQLNGLTHTSHNIIKKRSYKYEWYCPDCGQTLWKVKQRPSWKDKANHAYKHHKGCETYIKYRRCAE